MSELETAADAAAVRGPRSMPERIRAHVSAKIHRLAPASGRRSAESTADLARLRRGVGRAIGEDIALIGLTTGAFHRDGEVRGDDPTYAEEAIYAALTLFALHQQSKPARMHVDGVSLGRAAGKLRSLPGREAAATRAMAAIGSAASIHELQHHARGLIQLLRAETVSLDYAALAVDLYRLRFPEQAVSVRSRWGRDFFVSATADEDAAPTDAAATTVHP